MVDPFQAVQSLVSVPVPVVFPGCRSGLLAEAAPIDLFVLLDVDVAWIADGLRIVIG